ncbi:hypothetical protein ACIGZH_33325 [Streptomyces sp. NPDC058319]|uniref:hypothetical protein n=1 Tax=unclassified Streptomyces TaxID=2593676 RepID=UPI0036EFEDEB
MTSAAERPVLFLDVDGPLIPFGASYGSSTSFDQGNPLLDRLDPGAGSRLHTLVGASDGAVRLRSSTTGRGSGYRLRCRLNGRERR